MCLQLWEVLAAGGSRGARPAAGRQLQEVEAEQAAGSRKAMKADYVVIGAGLAGAAAARQIADRMGATSFIVLEGRNRIGGRTWTQQLTGKGGVQIDAELGAGWVHGQEGNPIVGLATSAKVSLAKRLTDYENGQLYLPTGGEAGDAQEARWEALFEEFEEFVAEKQEELEGGKEPGLGSVAQDFIRRKKLSGLDRLAFLSALNTNIEHEYSGPASQLSLFFDNESELGGGDKLVTGGYQRLAEWLLRGLDVRLGHTVTAIDSSKPTAITITTNRGTFTASQVVVAVPLGVLQRNAIRFPPSGLPAANSKAMGQLGMGLLNKLVLVFDHVWWDARLEVLNRISPRGDGAWSEFHSMAPVTGQPVLVAFNAAEHAARLEERGAPAVKDECLRVLRSMFGAGRVPEPLSYVVTAWGKDPFSFGSYSYVKRPQMGPTGATNARNEVAQPMASKRIFFAGEHTRADFPATTHGAVLSGRRAATDLLRAPAQSTGCVRLNERDPASHCVQLSNNNTRPGATP